MAIPSDWRGAYWGGAHTPMEIWSGGWDGLLGYGGNYWCSNGCYVPFQAWTQTRLETDPGLNSRFDDITLY